MPVPSDPDLLVLLGLRLRSFATGRGGRRRRRARRRRGRRDRLRPLERGRPGRRSATAALPGWLLTAAGRAEGERLLADELDAAGRPGRAVQPPTAGSWPSTRRCSTSAPPGSCAPSTASGGANDHADAAYDDAVRRPPGRRSTTRSSRCAPTLADGLERFGGYGPRLAERPGHGPGRRSRLVHQAHHRLVPHRLVRAARGPAGHARHRAGQERPEQPTPRRRPPDGPLRSRDHRHGHPLRRRRPARPRRAPPPWPPGWSTRATTGSCVTGTTGEASMLTDDEQVELWRAVRAAVDVPAHRRHRHQRHRPRRRAHRPGRPTTASTASSWSRRTTTARRRPGSRPTSGPSPGPPTCR